MLPPRPFADLTKPEAIATKHEAGARLEPESQATAPLSQPHQRTLSLDRARKPGHSLHQSCDLDTDNKDGIAHQLTASQQPLYLFQKSQTAVRQSNQDTSFRKRQQRITATDGNQPYPHIYPQSSLREICEDSPWPPLQIASPQTSAAMRSLLASRDIDTFDGVEAFRGAVKPST